MLVQPACKEFRARLEPQASKATRALLGRPAYKARQASRAKQGSKVKLESLVLLA